MKDLIEILEEYANGFTNVIAPPEDIKSMITKEQFSQMKYRIGE